MKFKTIIWNQHPQYQDNYQGKIGDQELFTIINIGKKDINFELKSYPIKTDTFHPSSSGKKLGEFKSLELAKAHAIMKWEEFTNSLLEVEELISA